MGNMSESFHEGPGLIRQWTIATWLGWVLGVVVLLVALVVGESFLPPSEFLIGICMGGGVGWMQGRVLAGEGVSKGEWTLVTMIGIGLPFILGDILAAFGFALPSPIRLPVTVAAGGFLAGLLQFRILRTVSSEAAWWVPAATGGWVLATLTASLSGMNTNEALGRWMSFLFSIGTIIVAGAVLGLLTGVVLKRVFDRPLPAVPRP